MIAGFRDDWLQAFFVDEVRSRNIPPDLEARLFRKLQMIDDAVTDQDLPTGQKSMLYDWICLFLRVFPRRHDAN